MLALVDRIEGMRTGLLDELAGLPPETLTARPAAGEWSVLEVVEHLVLSEGEVLANMDHPDRLRPGRPTLRSRFGYAAVLGILSSPIGVSVPSEAMKPGGERSLDELRVAWKASHDALRRHVRAVEEGRITGAVFRHPVSGPLTTGQALRMLSVHLKRHTKQIRRILESLGPGSST